MLIAYSECSIFQLRHERKVSIIHSFFNANFNVNGFPVIVMYAKNEKKNVNRNINSCKQLQRNIVFLRLVIFCTCKSSEWCFLAWCLVIILFSYYFTIRWLMCEDIVKKKIVLQFLFSLTKITSHRPTNSSFIRQWRRQESDLPLPDAQFTLSLLSRYEMSCQHLFPPTQNLLCFTGILFLNKPHHILVFLSLDQIKQAEGVSNEPL